MKNNLRLFSLLMIGASATVVGCKNKNNDDPAKGRTAVTLTSSIDSRVANNAWETADKIGFFLVGDDAAANVELTPQSDNSLTFASPVYYPTTGNVDLVAYYPYTAGTTYAGGLAVTTGDQSAGLAQEVLYAKKADQAASTTPVALEFSYALARLEITVDVQDPGIDLDDLTLSLNDAKTAGTLNLSTGAITPSGQPTPSILLHKKEVNGSNVIFEALVVPQNADGLSFVAAEAGVDKVAESLTAPTSFAAGATYTKTLTILAPPAPDYIPVNGVKWAKANLSALGTFAATGYEAGEFFYPDGGGTPSEPNFISYSSDPCPSGWHIAKLAEWYTLFITGVTNRSYKQVYGSGSVWSPTQANATLDVDSWESLLILPEGNYRTTDGSNMFALNTPESWSPPGWQEWGDNWAGLVRCVKD
ncbi:MAG: fimbrillin family protein [Rikenellaceae bacterium]|nr:fimbrillin family protein [Rikenellaceae bacterium]